MCVDIDGLVVVKEEKKSEIIFKKIKSVLNLFILFQRLISSIATYGLASQGCGESTEYGEGCVFGGDFNSD